MCVFERELHASLTTIFLFYFTCLFIFLQVIMSIVQYTRLGIRNSYDICTVRKVK